MVSPGDQPKTNWEWAQIFEAGGEFTEMGSPLGYDIPILFSNDVMELKNREIVFPLLEQQIDGALKDRPVRLFNITHVDRTGDQHELTALYSTNGQDTALDLILVFQRDEMGPQVLQALHHMR